MPKLKSLVYQFIFVELSKAKTEPAATTRALQMFQHEQYLLDRLFWVSEGALIQDAQGHHSLFLDDEARLQKHPISN